MIDETEVECPYCGEPFSALIDWSAGGQRYVEDCPVCCRPIEFALGVDERGERASVSVYRDDE